MKRSVNHPLVVGGEAFQISGCSSVSLEIGSDGNNGNMQLSEEVDLNLGFDWG